ncbi:MAG: SDR family NAD(P)-dependent oxidoreductase [Polyangiales bacterium]
MKTLKDKVVAITGAGSGIGRSLAVLCAEHGAKVAISDVNEAGLAETEAMVRAKGAKVHAQKLDVASREGVFAWAETVKSALGPANVIVNNAGVSLSETVELMTLEDFEWLMNINFWGVVYGTKAFLPQLLSQPDGHVVNISSVFGIIGVPTQSAYNAAKFAVRGFTESLRQELAQTKVRVTSVHPGGIKTGIVRNGRHYHSASGATDTKTLAKDFEKMARTTPDEAARQIVGAILKEKPRLLIGPDAYLIDRMQRLMPETYDKLLGKALALQPKSGS